jgi:hypothetical protein
MILRDRWCHIIVLNIHAPTEDKIDDMKGSRYEELENGNNNKIRASIIIAKYVFF